ncbi:hypothetical protein CDL15_Pgr006280 [Punica granatum]|uniref:F-box protein At1g78280 n=2 Tax=Punica granatum TaxID=22663 RepID=A0A218X5K2_PUNGR|nr:hypothetical protein CDL15_Pgr006280 [Punica granatum]
MANLQPGAPFEYRDRRHDALGELTVLPDEIICSILENLAPRDVGRLSCVSSVMYILCNEEPLWMSVCLKLAHGELRYRGSWKKTALYLENVPVNYIESDRSPLHFDGFNSLFLYRRLYRCHTTLDGFSMDSGNVERKDGISLEEFNCDYDVKKPVLLDGLANAWPARTSWTIDKLLLNHGDKAFRISQKSAQKISMKLKDYVTYMNIQHDEDPLYIFEDKFGEIAPGLLKDYHVPHLFQEDFFDVLDGDQRPPFRWLIIGPQRSGASWHVDPALTSAWNTLLCGRKRWALYPPGKVPLGVTVHVNDEDGDVNVETPSSLQWWLDFYPLLADEDKPIECTQLPGETIFVPSGWWHCVLNLETTVAVTQNFVNPKNFEFVCLDMAPGYRHKGVCRAGLLALDDGPSVEAGMIDLCGKDDVGYSDLTRKEKRMKIQQEDGLPQHGTTNESPRYSDVQKRDFCYDIDFLAMFLDKDKDHYNAPWASGNCIGPREMREWLFRLWVGKPGMRELIWKGACLALSADKWYNCLRNICMFHNLPHPTDDQKLPVGTGSNPVYLMADHVVKIFVEDGLENSLYCLGSELEFYTLLCKLNSSLRNYMPEILSSGIIYLEDGSFTVVPWDGQGLPKVIAECNLLPGTYGKDSFPFGLWSKKQYELRRAGTSPADLACPAGSSVIWPYVITKRCEGKIYAQLRDKLSWKEALNLASFLGEQLHDLHLLPLPPFSAEISDIGRKVESKFDDSCMEVLPGNSKISAEWEIFIRALSSKRMGVSRRLRNWGDPIPDALIKRVDEYLPNDLTKFLTSSFSGDEANVEENCKPSWIHSDIMDDNIHMESCSGDSDCNGKAVDEVVGNGSLNGHKNEVEEGISWRPSHILDFSDLTVGDPLYDVIPIYLDVFRGDTSLLKQLLQSYKLPLSRWTSQRESEGIKTRRLSYRAMCYCILHDENILGAIFTIWKELRKAESWEEVERVVWGELNSYNNFS